MSNELQTTNTQITPHMERIRRLCVQYNSDYPSKPAPVSLELIADNRHKLLTLDDIAIIKGSGFLVTLVTDCITHILEKFVYVKRAMDENMVVAVAEMVCRKYPAMTPADVKLFMTKGVMGEYGQILDRVDGALILSWASQYWEQMKHLIKLRQRNAEKDDPRTPVPEAIEKLSEQLRIKETSKRTLLVVQVQRPTLAEEYAARAIDLDKAIEERK